MQRTAVVMRRSLGCVSGSFGKADARLRNRCHQSHASSRSIFNFGLSSQGAEAAKTAEEFYSKIRGIHETVLKPLNTKLLGPLEKTQDEFAPLPQVLILGNHSSGKSTFINYVCGRQIQTTGVAPTDDGFTIIAPGNDDLDQDGPSVVGDPNLGFSGLRMFGTGLINHMNLRIRKGLHIDDLMLIDSPGMIDSPAHSGAAGTSGFASSSAPGSIVLADGTVIGGGAVGAVSRGKDRGYDFAGVVKWLAERADVILLFQDPAKPGTTGETLNIMTTSLVGQDHKTFILLNKADQFSTVHDFARAYGALCWNLSKVIPRKDLPRIYTMCVPVVDNTSSSSVSAQQPAPPQQQSRPNDVGTFGTLKEAMADLEAARNDIVTEVRRAPMRRVDNMITRLYDSARLLRMHAVVMNTIKKDYTAEAAKLWGLTAVGVASLGSLSGFMMFSGLINFGAPLAALTMIGGGGASYFVQRQLQKKVDYYLTDGHGIDEAFRKSHFIQLAERDEFVAQLFERVRPSLQTTLRTVGIRSAPSVRKSDLAALDQIIDQDAPSLRRAATKAGSLTGTTPGVVRGGAAASASSATAAGSGTAASGSDGVKR